VIRIGDVIVAPSLLRSGYAGCLVAHDGTRADEDLAGLMAVAAAALGLVVSSERMIAEAELRTRSEFVNALLSPDVDQVSIRRRARNVGVDLDRITVVAVFASRGEESRDVQRLAARLSASFQGWSAEHRDHVVALLPKVDVESVRAQLRRLHGDPLPCAVGLAPCAGDVDAVRESHELARQTATVLDALGRGHTSAQASELGVYRSLFSQSGRDEISAFIERTVGPVIAYDTERQRDLGLTLLTYLQQAQHHGRTCQLLHIHANTLYQRLDRVTQLLGDRWREPDLALEIQLALKLSQLVHTLSQG
jgi:sugar diacid utilization regulator